MIPFIRVGDPHAFAVDGHGTVRFMGRWRVEVGTLYLLCELPAAEYRPREEVWFAIGLLGPTCREAEDTKERIRRAAAGAVDVGARGRAA